MTLFYFKDWGIRETAAEALGSIKDPRAFEALIAALKKDPHTFESLIESLIDALNDNDSGVRRSAAEALEKITKRDFGKDRAKWLEWWEKNKGKRVIP